MKNIELIIFDLDGTLFKPDQVIVKAVYQAIESTSNQFGLDIKYPSREKIYASLGQLDYRFVDELDLNLNPEQADYLKSSIAEIEGKLVEQGIGRLYDGALETLKSLKDLGYQLAIASNLGREYLLALLDHFDLDQFIDFSVCIDDVGRAEKRDILEEIINNQEVLSSEVVFVADRESDFLAAKELDIKTIGCTWGFGRDEELRLADYRVSSFDALVKVFE